MKRRVRQKTCDRCSCPSPTLYRVQYDDSGNWHFVCPDCWSDVSHSNSFYVYGGTWKSKK